MSSLNSYKQFKRNKTISGIVINVYMNIRNNRHAGITNRSVNPQLLRIFTRSLKKSTVQVAASQMWLLAADPIEVVRKFQLILEVTS